MDKGAIIIKIGKNEMAHGVPERATEDMRKYLLDELLSRIKEAKERYSREELAEVLKGLSVKYDPDYEWEE